jgi:hypothetical protein
MAERSSAQYGMIMIVGIIGGVILLGLRALPGFFAFVIGALILFFAFGILAAKKPEDRIPGFVLVFAGALTILSKFGFLRSLAGFLLKAGAIALLVAGLWSGIQFLLNLRKRP